MKGAVRFLTTISCAITLSAPIAFAKPAAAGTQTHCDSCGPYTTACQGVETYINLDGTASTGAGVLTFSWTSDCPNADLLNPTSATPVLILYNPGLGISTDCKVYLQINDFGPCGCQGNCSCIDQCESTVHADACQVDCEGTINGTKVIDRCGVCGGDGNSCLGCSNFDITQDQFALDGNTFALKKLVNKVNKSLNKISRSSNDKAFIQKSNKDADKLYKQSWTLAWTLPHIVTSCTNQVFCTSVSNTPTLAGFNSASEALNNLVKSSVKRLQKLSRKKTTGDAKTLAKGDSIHQQNLTISSGIPAVASACTAP